MSVPNATSIGYADAAPTYWKAGWPSPLPLKRGHKWPPPTNYTGAAGLDPSYPDILQWGEQFPDGNLCLRVPDTIIGIDVDAYNGKTGAATLAEAEKRWGALPPTTRSTSRTDGVSGIRLFRVPASTRLCSTIGFPDQGIGDIEIVQHHHRYVVAWPSTHPEGGLYEWLNDDDNRVGIPALDPPPLPQRWLDELREQDASADTLSGASYSTQQALTSGEPSAAVAERFRQAVKELNTPGSSRHDTCLRHVLALLRMGKNGEPGVESLLIGLGAVFVSLIAPDRPGGKAAAEAEFKDMVEGPGAARSLSTPSYDDWTKNIPPTNGAQPDGAPSNQPDTRGPARFFMAGIGLLALNLSYAVTDVIDVAYNEDTKHLYCYADGVWHPDQSRIEARIVDLLGNRYRPAHRQAVLDVIRHSDSTLRISCDPQPSFINVGNGMLQWGTGQLLPHAPAFLSTVQLPVDYHDDATCPAFDEFLAQVLSADCIELMWEVIGYLMFSGNPLHTAILLFGIGRNGKGTLIRVLRSLLGDDNCSAVGLHDLTENRFRSATLYGKLANLAGDLDAKWIANTASFKAITGGDRIQGEYKYGAAFDFVPWAVPLYSANKAFGSADSSEGWVSRWTVVPFPHTFDTDERDIALDTKLHTVTELQGVMNHGVRSLRTLLERRHFAIPPSGREAKEAFVASSDAVRSWISEACDRTDLDAWESRTHLYNAFCRYTITDGAKTMSSRDFYQRIEQISGIVAAKIHGTRGFKGIQLTSEGAGLGADLGNGKSWWTK